jgi:hypothetical protein
MVEDCYDPYKKPESVTHDQIEQLTELVAFLYQKLDEKHVLNRYDIKEIFTMGFRIEDE